MGDSIEPGRASITVIEHWRCRSRSSPQASNAVTAAWNEHRGSYRREPEQGVECEHPSQRSMAAGVNGPCFACPLTTLLRGRPCFAGDYPPECRPCFRWLTIYSRTTVSPRFTERLFDVMNRPRDDVAMNGLSLNQLRSLVRSPRWRSVDRTERVIRSIQQSLHVEGYEVERSVVAEALQREQGTKASKE